MDAFLRATSYEDGLDIPASALVYAWIPFAVVVVAILGFATFYVSLYKHTKVEIKYSR